MEQLIKPTNSKLAFTQEYKNFRVEALWGNESEALIIVYRDNTLYRQFNYPSYRIFNIAAHFSEMVDSLLMQEEVNE